MSPMYPNVAAVIIANLVRTGLADSDVRLFSNDIVPNAGTVIGDLTEATFSGYAAKNVVAMLATYIDPRGGASFQTGTQQFQHNGGGVAETIYGAYVTETGGGLVLVWRFDEAIPMTVATDAIPLDVVFNFGKSS